jgi:hypothetical protein
MMSRTVFLVAVLLSSPAMALPATYYGAWSTKKGACKKEDERRIVITKDQVKRYENFCKIDREEVIGIPGVPDYKLSVTCDQEGDTVKSTLFISGFETPDQFKMSEGNTPDFAWVFRCKK